jgi:hypothetical protein
MRGVGDWCKARLKNNFRIQPRMEHGSNTDRGQGIEDGIDEPQLLHELKATGSKVGLLVNFGRTKVI